MAPGGRALGLPLGRLHGKQLLASCMKAALLAAIRERQVRGVTHPPSIEKKKNNIIRIKDKNG